MFSQLFLTTGLILIPLIFFIMTISITQKNINYINPNSEKRVGNSELLLSGLFKICLLYTSPSPRDGATSRMPSSA